LLNRANIFLWNNDGTFPASLKWKNAPFYLKRDASGAIGLFTDSTNSFNSGQDIGFAFIKISSSGYFMDDYFESNIGLMINNSESPNVTIVSGSQGLMMQANTYIAPNTEITVKYQDILDLFPNDITAKMLIHK